MKRALTIPALALAALLLAGCSAGMGGGASSDSSAVLHGAGPEMAPFSVSGGAADGAVGAPSAVADRSVITTGNVSITAADPIGAADGAIKLVAGAGGRVDSRSEQPATETQRASASLTIRVPADQLDVVLDKIKQLGTVNSVSLNASDVTQQKQDVEARITALQTSVDRLLELMSKSATTADLIAIESALSSRQAELDSLTTQLDYLDDQIDYSTLYVDFASEGTVNPGNPDNFWSGLLAGWNSLVAFLGGFVVVLGVALPWLVLLTVIGAVVWAIVASVRRRRHPAPSTPAPAPVPEEDVQQ
ncbi:DUF4349 domain-containing protein [Microterricola pindariensis]|uniref:DUF4349 domain-containing protein n=1 Tax=Microterricola pindariensis TaxID=478010 RepID=A0ABX5AUZ6_9MICO|nr:DUF4349 domain-containing protein [Microterricola pindariensis]PPL17477.1 hypothetical protein GY24_11355 [Microterricola pindariensis]